MRGAFAGVLADHFDQGRVGRIGFSVHFDFGGGNGVFARISGLQNIGESILDGIHYIERGYVDLDKMLRDVGADIIKL